MIRYTTAVLALACLGAAQTTTRVQGNNLVQAIAAAKPGDILLVSGYVSAPITVSKPLFLHGQQMAVISSIHITGIPAGSSFVLQNVYGPLVHSKVTVSGCAGQVHLSGTTVRLNASNCADLSIAESTCLNLSLTNCRTSLYKCSVDGTCLQRGLGQVTTAITNRGGALTVVSSRVTGGCADVRPGAPGIDLVSGSLEIAGNSRIEGGTSWQFPRVQPIFVGGPLTYDPSTVLVPALGGSVKATVRPIPFVAMAASAIGSNASVSLFGTPTTAYGLFVGLPGPSLSVPGITGRLAIQQPILLRVGTMTAAGAHLTFRVPNDPLLRGAVFRWQGIEVRNGQGTWSTALTECHF